MAIELGKGSEKAIGCATTRTLLGAASGSAACTTEWLQQSIEQPEATIPLAIGQSGPMLSIAIGQPVTQVALWPKTQIEAASAGCATRRAIARTAANWAIRFIGCFDCIEHEGIGLCAGSLPFVPRQGAALTSRRRALSSYVRSSSSSPASGPNRRIHIQRPQDIPLSPDRTYPCG